jgi:glycosyltransferase involved in cell wall biosynthesis
LHDSISKYNPDVLAIHFPDYRIIHLVKNISKPKVVWIHGHEILFSTRISSQSNNLLSKVKKSLFLFPRQLYQMSLLRNFLPQVSNVVFVSKWMQKAAEKSVLKKFKNGVVIPNPVDVNLFKYKGPNTNKEYKAISIRGLHNTKYGVDIGIKAFSEIKNIAYDIFGQGKLYPKYVDLIKSSQSNSKIYNKSLNHNEIPTLLENYHIFVAPSRVEAQGVSMCEAMSTGLPVVATNIGGIPEFVRDGIDGYLVNPENPEAIKKAIQKLISNPKLMEEFGKNARNNIIDKCSGENICNAELNLLKNSINTI